LKTLILQFSRLLIRLSSSSKFARYLHVILNELLI
jgi:hypothetical protein